MNTANRNLPQTGMSRGTQAVAGTIAACLIGAGVFYAFLSGVENGSATAHAAGSTTSGSMPLWALALIGGVSIAVVSTLLFGFAHFDAAREGGANRGAVRQIRTLVPTFVQWISGILLASAIASGFVYTFLVGFADGGAAAHLPGSPVPHSALPWGLGMFAGILIAVWLLLVGYVYADARRRAMPAGLWTLIVVVVPNVVGFLLYFALRRPLPAFCSQCGHTLAVQHKFCPSCGQQQAVVSTAHSGQSVSASESQTPSSNFAVGFLTFCMMIFLFNAFSLYRKHDHTGGIVWLVAAAVCVGFSVYAAQAKSKRYE
jgi:hypothetical protein